MTATINVFKLPQVVNLTLAPSTGANLMNYSATRSDFKVMKGITNEIHFFVKDNDRRPVVLHSGETLEIVITDRSREHEVAVVPLTLYDPQRSIWLLTLMPEDITSWPLDTLSYSVVLNHGNYKTILYTDRSYGGFSELKVMAGPYPEGPKPEDYAVAKFLLRNGSRYSSAVPASLNKDFPQVVFSADFHGDEHFEGIIKMQASMDHQPDTTESSWVDIASAKVGPGVNTLTAYGTFEWVRFVVTTTSLKGRVNNIVLSRRDQ